MANDRAWRYRWILVVNGDIKAWAMNFCDIMKENNWWRSYSDECNMFCAEIKYAGGELLG